MGILSSIFGSGPKATQTPFSQTSTGTQSSSFTPVAPEGYLENLFGFKPGTGGFNPAQQGGMDWYTKMMGNPDPANLGMTTGYFQDTLANREAPTLRNLTQLDPTAYATPANVSADQISAQQGAKFMDQYRNPFEDQVVQSALGDLERQFGATQNASNMQQAASGAFGGGRHALREAAVADDYLRTVGATSGGLRAQGFNTAAGLGMQDANRDIGAQQANQSANLAASTFNNQQQQQRNMFDANMGMQYNDQRDGVAKTLADLGVLNLGVGQDLAGGMFGMGTTGQGQNLDWLQQFAPLFGGTETGTQSENTSGFNTQIQPGSGGLLGTLGPLMTGLGGLGLKF